jgi:hypothetical protein
MIWLRANFIVSFAVLALVESPALRSQTTVYNLTSDWSATSTANPNGQWSLRYGTTVLTNRYWLASENAWIWDVNSSTNPSFAFETAAKTGWNDGLAGDIVMQGVTTGSAYFASQTTTFANVAWTAPSDGTITISGRTWDAYGGRSGAWTLNVNGTEVAGGNIAANSTRGSSGVTFAGNIISGQTLSALAVFAGQQVVFNQYGATAGIEMTVAFTAVPEPATCAALAGLVVLGIAARRRRRRSTV